MKGESVSLKESTPTDRVKAYEWLYFSDLPKSSYAVDSPGGEKPTLEKFSLEYDTHFFDGSAPDKGRGYMIELKSTGEQVGFISYDSRHLQKGIAEIDIWMKSMSYTRHGLGSKAMKELLNKLFLQGFHTVIFRPENGNEPAIKAGEKLGFSPMNNGIESFYQPEYADCAQCNAEMLVLKK